MQQRLLHSNAFIRLPWLRMRLLRPLCDHISAGSIRQCPPRPRPLPPSPPAAAASGLGSPYPGGASGGGSGGSSSKPLARPVNRRSMVSALPTSRSSSITEPDLERLASLCQRLESDDATEEGRDEQQVDLAAEVRALRLLLEEADLTLPELEQLVLRYRGEPFSRLLCSPAKSGWSSMNILPALRGECGMSRRQVAEAIVKCPDLLSTYTSDATTTVRRLRWHLCTDWGSKQERWGEDSLAATLVREPRLLLVERDALQVKIHDLLRLLVHPKLPVPEDPLSIAGQIDWERYYCGMLQPALREFPAVLVGKGIKNMRKRIEWLAGELSIQERATPQAARLLVLAGGADINALESRCKMLRHTTGLASGAALRDYLLEWPRVLLVDAKSVEAAYRVLLGRCPDQSRVQAALRQLLSQYGRQCGDHAATIDI